MINYPNTPFSLRARLVLPIAGPPIDGGCVTVDAGKVVSVGRQTDASKCLDLGDVALLPGLVNAHVHLDLSDAPKPLGRPGMSLVDWLGEIMRHKLQQKSIEAVVTRGLRESTQLGTTTLADIAQQSPSEQEHLELRAGLLSLLELIAPTTERVAPAIERAETYLASAAGKPWLAGLSPHAPYSVHPDVLARAVALSAEHHVPLAMHLAESPEELELIAHRRGPFRDLLEQLGLWEPDALPEGSSVHGYLQTLAGAHRTLLIHGNYLDSEDLTLLAAHADRMAVVYCPRTHAYFEHAPYPLEQMLEAGVRVALGTDSRASSPDLSILAEMRQVYRRHRGLSPERIVRLGTADGAAALGRSHELGTIEPGRQADLVSVALPGAADSTTDDPYRRLLEADTQVAGVWRQGRPVPIFKAF